MGGNCTFKLEAKYVPKERRILKLRQKPHLQAAEGKPIKIQGRRTFQQKKHIKKPPFQAKGKGHLQVATSSKDNFERHAISSKNHFERHVIGFKGHKAVARKAAFALNLKPSET